MSAPLEWICKKMKTRPLACLVVAGLIVCLFAFAAIGFGNDKAEKFVEETTAAQWMYSSNNYAVATTMKMPELPKGETTVICVVACGTEKLDETLVMIKSALVFTRKPIRFIVITEYKLIPAFHEKLEEWRQVSKKNFQFTLKPVAYPKYVGNQYINETEWRKIFKDCASLRLFLPDILNSTDSVLYVDTDTVFLAQPENVWRMFNNFNSTQYAALAPECEEMNTCWYPRFAKHPYVPPMGVNSGVMLMNLTRMREVKWTNLLVPIYKEYKTSITWGDQDIINIIFSFKREGLYILDCSFNFRPDHCMYMPVCKEAEEHGAYIIHGSRGAFQNQKQPPFYGVYQAMRQYHFNIDSYVLLFWIKDLVSTEKKSGCSKSISAFISRPELNLGMTNFTENYLDLTKEEREQRRAKVNFILSTLKDKPKA